ncbi:MAG: aminoacylase [Steroidobacteraceae bacterium]|nr:aminoacylase [Steroidobacteraceae bacterium]
MSRYRTFTHRVRATLLAACLLASCGCVATPSAPPGDAPASRDSDYDVIVRHGTVYDGSGAPGRRADVGIRGDRVVTVGDLESSRATTELDATGRAVAPGFINVLSWANVSLIADGRGMSDLKQGVTLEIFGEGESGGPLNDRMKANLVRRQGDIRFDVDWTSFGEFLDGLVRRGVSPNVASFVGATTVREHVLGEGDVDPTPVQLAEMQDLVRQAMREGALGVGSSLIYAPAYFAETPELIALAHAASEFGGGYVSHVRNESDRLPGAIAELIEITRAAGVHGEAYHLKAAGEANWPNMERAIAQIERAREAGVSVGANMYTYVAGSTGLDAAMPLWVQAGGLEAWVARLKDPAQRAKVIADIRTPPPGEENLLRTAGTTDRVLFVGFKNPALKPLTGKTLTEVMALRGTSAEDTIVDLVIEDNSRVQTVYFLMSEDNVKRGLAQPWVSLGSDAEALAPEGVFTKSSTHPRAYGNFARLLGKYVRDEGIMSLAEAIRRLTGLPAANWKLRDRGCLREQCFADLVVFDPATITDHATFAQPKQYATGVAHVLVNGRLVIRAGEHTGAKPGRVVRGPGYTER